MIVLRLGSGARLRVKAFGGGGTTDEPVVPELDVLLQVLVVVPPTVEMLQVVVVVDISVPAIAVQVVTVVGPVVVVTQVVEFEGGAGKPVGERIGASTIEVG